MATETAMMLHHPDMDHPYDPFNGREVEPVTDLHREWLARLTTDVVERRTQVLFTAGFGARDQASEHWAELARREAERSA